MKKGIALFALLFALVAFNAPARAADPCEGYWKSVDEKGKVTAYWLFVVKKGTLYGYLVSWPDEKGDDKCTACTGDTQAWYNKPIKGTAWLKLKERDDDGVWEDGYIIDSGKGDLYEAEVEVEDGKLLVRGYIGFIYKTQTWYKATKAAAESGKF